jgi:hypothetical protein
MTRAESVRGEQLGILAARAPHVEGGELRPVRQAQVDGPRGSDRRVGQVLAGTGPQRDQHAVAQHVSSGDGLGVAGARNSESQRRELERLR